MFNTLGLYLLVAMEWVNDTIINNFALSVIFFTFLLKLLTMPFDIKQRRSMGKMSAAQGELAKIKKRYEGNAELMQKKQTEYYKKNNISPYAGCLPMIVTMLFFIVFLRGMNYWANMKSIELFLDPSKIDSYRMLWINNIWMPDSGLSHVIMSFEQFAKLPFDNLTKFFDQGTIDMLKTVTQETYNAKMSGVTAQFTGYMNGWFILPLLAGGSMLLTTMIQNKLNPTQANAQGAGMTKNMMYVFSAFSVYICITSNSAFSLYWLASNIFSMLLQIVLKKTSKDSTAQVEEGTTR